MNKKLSRGASIVASKWLQLSNEESLLIVSSEKHRIEAEEIMKQAMHLGANVEIFLFPDQKGQVGHYYDENETAFDEYDVILGATTHSLVTTKAVKRAVERGSRFLSLPLSTNDGRSLLEYDFIQMNPDESQSMGDYLLPILNQGNEIMVTTTLGTSLAFYKENRDARLFHGSTKQCKGYASSSFEIFIPIEETKTFGVGYVDASLGYLGLPKQPVKIQLQEGKITEIEDNETGRLLKEYLEHFNDDGMYVAGEFGIGLNTYSKCSGNCYIEDESAYGTFHIGFGRNIAFGGVHQAVAHFDLVFDRPDIYVDGQLIMKQGEIIYSNTKHR